MPEWRKEKKEKKEKGSPFAWNDAAFPEGQMSQNKYPGGWEAPVNIGRMARANHPENGSRNVCDGRPPQNTIIPVTSSL